MKLIEKMPGKVKYPDPELLRSIGEKLATPEEQEKALVDAQVATAPVALTDDMRKQLQDTVDLGESCARSNPADYHALELLRSAYRELGETEKVHETAFRLASAYITHGMLSSAIRELHDLLAVLPESHPLFRTVGNELARIEECFHERLVEVPVRS